MDYKELIEELRTVAGYSGDCYDCNQCLKAATAIKTLLAEREAAVAAWTRIEYRNEKGGCYKVEWQCESCGVHVFGKTKFCPYCGSKMDLNRGPTPPDRERT